MRRLPAQRRAHGAAGTAPHARLFGAGDRRNDSSYLAAHSQVLIRWPMSDKLRTIAGAAALLLLLGVACSNSNYGGPRPPSSPGIPAPGDDDGYPAPDGAPPAPWRHSHLDVHRGGRGRPGTCSRFPGPPAAGRRGALYYAYLKFAERDATCDIAVFGGGVAPGVNYELKVAVLPAGATAWSVERCRSATQGLRTPRRASALMPPSTPRASGSRCGRRGPGLASCGSSDLVIATRSGPESWSLTTPATSSGDCCAERTAACEEPCLELCEDPNCTAGTDVGAWAAVANGPADLMAAFTDYHNYWDQDGQNHQGLELWEQGGGISGIRPWSGFGLYAALRFAGDVPLCAFTGYKDGGLQLLRRESSTGGGNDWQPWSNTELFTSWKVGSASAWRQPPTARSACSSMPWSATTAREWRRSCTAPRATPAPPGAPPPARAAGGGRLPVARLRPGEPAGGELPLLRRRPGLPAARRRVTPGLPG